MIALLAAGAALAIFADLATATLLDDAERTLAVTATTATYRTFSEGNPLAVAMLGSPLMAFAVKVAEVALVLAVIAIARIKRPRLAGLVALIAIMAGVIGTGSNVWAKLL